ncbi:MAG: hypothetical protein KA318_06160 [Nitrosomonas sp.]|jgi:hypothetical protein|nr:hypothetical protein [Nitrosomonas sp.]
MVIDKNIDLLFKKSKTLGGSVVFGLTALIDTIRKFFQNCRTHYGLAFVEMKTSINRAK